MKFSIASSIGQCCLPTTRPYETRHFCEPFDLLRDNGCGHADLVRRSHIGRCAWSRGVRESAGVSDEEREHIEALFDEWGEAEWDRMEVDVAARVSLEIHRRFLARYLPLGRVLEVGAGAGRFTVELARSGRSVVVGDLSRVQLELNARHVAEAGCQAAIEARLRVDICDLSGFETGSFDGVVAFGGPLSYVLDRAPEALSECLRVLRPGGTIVASVMSLAGSARHFLPNFPAAIAGRDCLCSTRSFATATSAPCHPPIRVRCSPRPRSVLS
jgi:SAM-dependent methyltransferase